MATRLAHSVGSTGDLAFESERKQPRQSKMLKVQVYSSFEELPAPHRRLFREEGCRDFFLTPEWFELFAAAALNEGDQIRIYCVTEADDLQSAAGLFVARTTPQSEKRPGFRKLSALANYYTCFYAVHLPAEGIGMRDTLGALARALAEEKPRWGAVEIQPLDQTAEATFALRDALKSAGFVVQTFFCFGNWHHPVNGQGFAEYMRGRPSVLKNTLSRKRKKLEQSGRAKIEIVTGGDRIESAIQDYTSIYLASWKQPEPYPHFIPGLIRTCAGMGNLRLGLLYVDNQPAAAQLWIVHHGAALIYKLAYDPRFAELSVGTILTATLMEHAIDIDKVEEVDYLSGDDSYKKDWMSLRRERIGILALNPRTVGGALAIGREVGGHALKKYALQFVRTFRALGVAARVWNKEKQISKGMGGTES